MNPNTKEIVMTNVLTRALFFSGAVALVAAALMLSGGASHAKVLLQEGINNVGGEVVQAGEVIGQDPDIDVRSTILQDYNSQDGDN